MTEQPPKLRELMNLPPPRPAHVLAELERELTMRASVYPGLIYARKLREHEAWQRNACLQKAIRDLREFYRGLPDGR